MLGFHRVQKGLASTLVFLISFSLAPIPINVRRLPDVSLAPSVLSVGTGRVSLGQLVDNLLTRVAAFTGWMSETAATYAILDIENEIVTRTGCDSHRDSTQSQSLPGFPGNDMISARRVSACAETTDDLSTFVVQR